MTNSAKTARAGDQEIRAGDWVGPLLMILLTAVCAWFIASSPGPAQGQSARFLFVGAMLLVLLVYARDLVVYWRRRMAARRASSSLSKPSRVRSDDLRGW